MASISSQVMSSQSLRSTRSHSVNVATGTRLIVPSADRTRRIGTVDAGAKGTVAAVFATKLYRRPGSAIGLRVVNGDATSYTMMNVSLFAGASVSAVTVNWPMPPTAA